jgi:Domain of unknown function (DUF4395)
MSVTTKFFSFPNPVNDVATRITAGCIATIAVLALVFHQPWLIAVLAYGFVARVLAGPRLSPLALLVTRVIVPRLHLPVRAVPGPPKRFAQTIGAVVTLAGTVCYFGFGLATATYALLVLLALFAVLESALGLCVGCKLFALGMRLGLVPAQVCAECENIWSRISLHP